MKNLLLPCLFTLSLSFQSFSQDLIMDLSLFTQDTVHIPMEATKNLKLKIINKMPTQHYTVSIQTKTNPTLPLTLPADLFNDETENMGIESFDNDQVCSEVEQIQESFINIGSEQEIPALLNYLKLQQQEMQTIDNTGTEELSECTQRHALQLEYLSAATVQDLQALPLQANSSIQVVVSRNDAGETRQWVYHIESPKRGDWNVGYGFTFITELFSKEGTFFLKESGTEYQIKRNSTDRWMEFAPTLIFSFTPTKKINANWSPSIIGGLGYDLEKPVVLLGVGLTYNQNLSINVGLAAHEQQQLNGRYEEEDIINELISDDQLHQSVYRVNPFFSATYRFNNSPFR